LHVSLRCGCKPKAPDAADRHTTQTASFGQFACTPVRLPAGRTLQGLDYDLLHLVVAHLAWRALVGVRHTTLPDEPSGNGHAIYLPSLSSRGVC